ncbi:MAG TPA: aminopeptidase [Anaeromyxobacter sp.]|nr:aminopeptidase [Anaeromyxobacter sp.]
MRPDPRITELAQNLLGYSLRLSAGEVLYLDLIGADTHPLGQEIVRLATERGAVPYWSAFDDKFTKPFFARATEAQQQAFGAFHKAIMERVDAYLGIRAAENPFEQGDVPAAQKMLQQRFFQEEVHLRTRLKKRWCVLRWPNAAMALMAKKSVAAFEDFYFRVCNLDYAAMSRAMDPLVERMQRTDRVRLVGPGTDLEFSIRGMPAIKCDGKLNIPDGEVFTAPLKDSMNGVITYNTSALFQGVAFRGIRLQVKDGRIVSASSPENEAQLREILDTDEGARSFGEFSLGVNPFVLEPMGDALFDEKIRGSLHLTPGNAYEECDNGNRSSVHWDLVLIQRPEHGGGEIWFDGELVRKDGRFVPPELSALDAQLGAP